MIETDTIAAISTPAGVGGIAVARISGPKALEIADAIWKGKPLASATSHTAHFGVVMDADGVPLDQAVATIFREPASFTGEDTVEISTHGSIYVQQEILNSLIKAGARMAEAGEFTRRAFSNGKLDLAQAEAVADVIASQSREANRIALSQMRGQFSSRLSSLRDRLLELASLLELELDFSEEDVEFASRQSLLQLANEVKAEVDRLSDSFRAGSAIKNGIPVAIIGATNAGKSSLLNALLGDDKAIVSDIHGTTRDIVEDLISIGGYAFRLMDTAGLRDTADTIESLGIRRSIDAASKAHIVIALIDGQNPAMPQIPATDARIIKVWNKADMRQMPSQAADCAISAKTGHGIDALKDLLADAARKEAASYSGSVLVTNARHHQALLQASESIDRVIQGLKSALSGDLISIDLRLTIHHLSSILGQITTPQILSSIFSRFCIGK